MEKKKTYQSFRHFFLLCLLMLPMLLVSSVCGAQTVRNSNYSTVGHIDSDGTVRDSSYRTIGHVERDGTVRDGNYRTIGHMKDVPSTYAAALFFFFGLL